MPPQTTESTTLRNARTVVDLLLPPVCSICGDGLAPTDETVCQTCRDAFRETGHAVCGRCGAPRPRASGKRCPKCPPNPIHFATARAAFRYEGRLAEGIQALKYNHHHELARALARAMFMAFVHLRDTRGLADDMDDPTGLAERFDLLVPVPMHFTRRWKRGYNHAEVLAREFATLARLRLAPDLLVRTRRTPRQALLPPGKRLENVRGAFETPMPDRVRGLRIGLFDDVLTSGSTVNECARTLLSADAAEVHVIALTRA